MKTLASSRLISILCGFATALCLQAAIVTFNFSNASWRRSYGVRNATVLEQLSVDGIVVHGRLGTNTSHSKPTYYDTQTTVRIYKGNELTIFSTNGRALRRVEFAFQNATYAAPLSLSEGQAGTYAAEKSVGTWVADASDEVVQITFRNAATDNSQVRFTRLMVEYADEAATPLKLTIPSGGLATYYDAQPYVMPAGLTGHVVNSVSASSESAVGTLQTEAKYAAGMVVPPCEPLVLSGRAGGYDAVRRGTIDEPTHQMLLGTALDTMLSSSASGERCYTLRANEKGETAQIGFFVRQPAEGPLSIAAHECWLTLPSALGYEALLFDHVLLGIGQTNRGSHAPLSRIYDLGGRMVEKHERGLFIVNGQKRMMR